MKKYLNIILFAASALLLFACDKNASKETAPTDTFSIVKSDLAVAPEGGTCTIEVEATKAVTATPEREWCTVSVNGKVINVTATPNYSNESRYCRIKLESGSKVLYATVQQFGEVIDGLEGLSDVTAPVAGRKIEVAVKSNVPVEITTTETWIHPSYENGILTIDVEKNDEPRTRFGTVSYVAGSLTGSFEVTQYPELVKPESWVITEGTPAFDYPKFSTSASLSAEAEDMYVMYMVPKSKVEGEIDDWIFDNLAVQTRNEILAKVEAQPETAFKDYLTTGTDAVTFEDIKVGENYVIAIGFGENSYVSGRYQYKEVTIEDIRPAYFKWAGKWKITGRTAAYGTTTFTGEEEWTISIDENNLEKSLILKGVNSLADATVLAAGADVLKLDYLADGSVQLKTQKSAAFEFPSMGACNMLLAGFYTKNGSSYTVVTGTGSTLFSAALSEDGKSASITVGKRTSSGVDYDYVAFRMYLVNSAGSRYTLSVNSGAIPLAFEMTRVEE